MRSIFTYWEAPAGGAKPSHIDLCHQTIRKHCSRDFDIRILDEGCVYDYLDRDDLPQGWDKIKHTAHKTAYIRAALLLRHGGVWFDPDSIILKSPVHFLAKVEEHGLVVCEREPGVLLTSFIASSPKNGLLTEHREGIREAIAGNKKREFNPLKLFRHSQAEWESLGRVRTNHRYYACPAEWFAPVKPGDARKFLDRSLGIEDVITNDTHAIALRGYSRIPSAAKMSRDETLNADFLICRLFRKALEIDDEQKHGAYKQVSYHKQHSGSWSGPGSTVEAARDIIAFLPKVVSKYGIRSIGDMPCGDWTWMKEVDLSGIDYKGYDIVEFLIRANREKYPNVEFEVLDLLNDDIGTFDLIICRDFLFHISNEDAVKVLTKFRQSGSRFLMTTSFEDLEVNTDLPDGAKYGYRRINVKIPPYSMGEPLEFVREKHPECWNRIVGLWSLR